MLFWTGIYPPQKKGLDILVVYQIVCNISVWGPTPTIQWSGSSLSVFSSKHWIPVGYLLFLRQREDWAYWYYSCTRQDSLFPLRFYIRQISGWIYDGLRLGCWFFNGENTDGLVWADVWPRVFWSSESWANIFILYDIM